MVSVTVEHARATGVAVTGESVVCSAVEFNGIRERYGRAGPPSAERGWIPCDQRPGAS